VSAQPAGSRGAAEPSHASVTMSPAVPSPIANSVMNSPTRGANTTREKLTRKTMAQSDPNSRVRDTRAIPRAQTQALRKRPDENAARAAERAPAELLTGVDNGVAASGVDFG